MSDSGRISTICGSRISNTKCYMKSKGSPRQRTPIKLHLKVMVDENAMVTSLVFSQYRHEEDTCSSNR